MAETKKEADSYLKEVMNFYFAPELRSIATITYLGIFGYFTLYYVDNLLLAARFLMYVVLGETALTGVAYLFTGMAFVLSLVFPFFISFYSIFVLHRVWHKPHWSARIKWLITCLILVGGIFLITIFDESARLAARQDVLRSFVEDTGLIDRL